MTAIEAGVTDRPTDMGRESPSGNFLLPPSPANDELSSVYFPNYSIFTTGMKQPFPVALTQFPYSSCAVQHNRRHLPLLPPIGESIDATINYAAHDFWRFCYSVAPTTKVMYKNGRLPLWHYWHITIYLSLSRSPKNWSS